MLSMLCYISKGLDEERPCEWIKHEKNLERQRMYTSYGLVSNLQMVPSKVTRLPPCDKISVFSVLFFHVF